LLHWGGKLSPCIVRNIQCARIILWMSIWPHHFVFAMLFLCPMWRSISKLS
jgi:hypothetical protein